MKGLSICCSSTPLVFRAAGPLLGTIRLHPIQGSGGRPQRDRPSVRSLICNVQLFQPSQSYSNLLRAPQVSIVSAIPTTTPTPSIPLPSFIFEKAFKIDFMPELIECIDKIPNSPNRATSVAAYYAALATGTKLSNLSEVEDVFYHLIQKRDYERALVVYLHYNDLRAINRENKDTPAHPVGLMCQLMLIVVGMKKDLMVMKTVYKDILAIPTRSIFSKLTTTILLKAFSQFGDMRTLLECYERLYQYSILPEPIHWYCMLKGAARCGDPKHFARFFHRLVKKDLRPSHDMLSSFLAEWGANDDLTWKRSKDCNCREHDFAYMVELAQRVHNYKRAFEFVTTGVYNLDKQPTFQLYEMFLEGVSRDFPCFRGDVRSWKASFKLKYGSVDKPTVLEFEAWMEKVKRYIGEENLTKIKASPVVTRPKTRVTRREVGGMLNLLPSKERYVSQFTNDDNLFEFVPEYLRRLERETDEYLMKKERAKAEKAAQEEIEKARKKEREWRRLGFEGLDSVADEESQLHYTHSEPVSPNLRDAASPPEPEVDEILKDQAQELLDREEERASFIGKKMRQEIVEEFTSGKITFDEALKRRTQLVRRRGRP